MNQTRLLVGFGCFFAVASTGLVGDAAAELLEREGRFIRLTTDLASTEQADMLVASFDAAAPQWGRFWNLPDDALATWKVDAYVMGNRAEFERRGLIPPRVPDFPFGYALGNTVWVHAQQSEYYTRHLLLHEGVHSLAFYHFGGAGPTWYREGTAELLSTHGGRGGALRINQIPATRQDVPYWGRFKRMKQLRGQSAVPTLADVMRYKPDLRGDVGVYGWSWAAAMMLHAYPDCRGAFLDAARMGRDDGPGFNRRLQQGLGKLWPALAARWQLHCHDLDYGFDWSRERVALATSDPVWDGRMIRISVAADQGWQSVGVRMPGRQQIRLTPSGQITLAKTTKPWISEPPGITIQYHRSRPLGQLLLCVLPNAMPPPSRPLPALEIRPIVQETTIVIPQYSWLLMRVNEGVGELGDNAGQYDVKITRGDQNR